jgi:threonine/homoserine/homoserine lactone efflux protein
MLPATSLFAIFSFSFFVALAAVMSPGPISTTIVSQAPRRGWLAGPLVATGHALLELLMVLLITVGLGALLSRPGVQTAIALTGALLLAWMGGSMIWNIWRGRVRLPRADEEGESISNGRLVALGAAATVSNPFWYAWWVTVAAGYLAQAKALSLPAVLAFYSGHISADFAWDTVLSFVVGGATDQRFGRRWMTDAVYRALLAACGAFFLYLAWVFLVQGVAGLR